MHIKLNIILTRWKRVGLDSDVVERFLCSVKIYFSSEDNWRLLISPHNLELAGGNPTTTLIVVHKLLSDLTRDSKGIQH